MDNTTTAVSVQLCFGKVHHARLRPVRHAFTYGVYFLRVPLRAMTRGAAGLPALFSHNRFNLLSFQDRDYGDGMQTPLAWIDAVLVREGICDASGEVWLQTFPRVLGYVFNPVSFWFCHRIDGSLRAIVAEVRNTFGEKHCYLLDTGGTIKDGVELCARKIFHVSPFCKVAGVYRFRFMQSTIDTAGKALQQVTARIDHDDADGPLIRTSISGTTRPLSNAAIVRAFFGYPLMTVGVVVKIHWQAFKLWRKRIPFFSKPHPPSSEMSR